MWTKILILAVLWLAIFRFASRLLRFLAGDRLPNGRKPARPEPPHAPAGAESPKPGDARSARRGDVIDVEFEDLTPRSGA